MKEVFDGGFDQCLAADCKNQSCCRGGTYIGWGEFIEVYGGDCSKFPEGVQVYDARWDYLEGVGWRVKDCLGKDGCLFEKAGVVKPGICRTFPVTEEGVTDHCPMASKVSEKFAQAARGLLVSLAEMEQRHPQPSD